MKLSAEVLMQYAGAETLRTKPLHPETVRQIEQEAAKDPTVANAIKGYKEDALKLAAAESRVELDSGGQPIDFVGRHYAEEVGHS